MSRPCYPVQTFFRVLSGTLLLVLFSVAAAYSQDGGLSYTDSLRKRLDTTTVATDKVQLLMKVARVTMDRTRAGELADEAIELAQELRDQRLIADAYIQNGRRYMSNSALSDNLTAAMRNYKRAEQVAKENGLDDRLVDVYCGMSDILHYQGNDVKALTYSTQAMAVAAGVDDPRAKVRAYESMGDVYMNMNQMLLALRNYLNALDVAEKSDSDALMRDSYISLQYFFQGIKEYDKAIDYREKAYALDRKMWDNNMSNDLIQIGDLFLNKDQPDLALRFYERSISTADTLHFDLLKFNGYYRICLLYFNTQEYKKGLEYLYAHKGMLDILESAGFDFYIGELVATNYTEQGRYDSAAYYFRKSEPEAVQHGSPQNLYDFYMDYANYFKRTKNLAQAIVYCDKAYALAAASGALGLEEKSTDTLEGLQEAAGNDAAALVCNKRGAVERDSLRTQMQATDLMKLEVENEARRRDRLMREEQERTEHRHNVQYMGFTMALVALFVGLVMLGRLSVPLSLIRALVFVAFIFLFEFIIMLADKQIQAWTAEEPWKVLLLKIVLAAGMVPLHHWLEHKVVHYLSARKHRKHPVEVVAA